QLSVSPPIFGRLSRRLAWHLRTWGGHLGRSRHRFAWDGGDPPMSDPETRRRFPVGAELLPEGAHFRVWAPRKRQVELILERKSAAVPLRSEGNGYFSGTAAGVSAGTLYRF